MTATTSRPDSLVIRSRDMSSPPLVFERTDPAFRVLVELYDEEFLAVPGFPERRNGMIGRALDELVHTLCHLRSTAPDWVPGRKRAPIRGDLRAERAGMGQDLMIQDQEVMQRWERPLMEALADIVSAPKRSVLELGFGLGISASLIQDRCPGEHTIIESHPDIAKRAHRWRAGYPDRRIRILEGRWQDVLPSCGDFDAILFDTHPETQAERDDKRRHGTPGPDIFPSAARHLRPGGMFTYYSDEVDSLGRGHQQRLLAHFSEFRVRVVRDLQPPADCTYWFAPSMAVVTAVA